VIRPSAFCGVVGYKPSFGRIPRTGIHPLAPSLDHVGVHARSVSDAALVASLLTGRDGTDFGLSPSPAPAWPLSAPNVPLRIALLRTSAWTQVDRDQQALVESTAALLADAGAEVTELELPAIFEEVWAIAERICEAEAAAVNGALIDRYGERISAAMRDTVAHGRALSAPAYATARELQQAMITAYARTLAPYDAALTAATLGEAPQGLANTGNPLFCTPFSVVGAPAISLPAGRSARGLPLAIQLVGSWDRDLRLLEVALWVERLLDYRPGFPLMV
jgi:amidase